MNKRELLRTLLIQYFMCYTCTMLVTVVFAGMNRPPITELPVSFLWKAALFSLCAGLPALVYYTREELSRGQWWVRTIVHTALLEAVLMTAGHMIGMYRGIWGGLLFFMTVLIVDGAVRLFTYLCDRTTADAINRRLREEREHGTHGA